MQQTISTYNNSKLKSKEYINLFKTIFEYNHTKNILEVKQLKALISKYPKNCDNIILNLINTLVQEEEITLKEDKISDLINNIKVDLINNKEENSTDLISARLYSELKGKTLNMTIDTLNESILLALIEEAKFHNIKANHKSQIILDQRFKQSQSAKQRLIQGIQKYISQIAKDYLNRGLELEDLIQEGNIGAMIAIDKFDPSRNLTFLTYADKWIRQRMIRACTDQGSLEKYHMRTPSHMYTAIGRIQKQYPNLFESSEKPDIYEISKQTKTTVLQVKMALKVLSRSTVSLDIQLTTNDDSEASFQESIQDVKSEEGLNNILNKERSQAIWSVYNTLEPQEKTVLNMRLGLNGPHYKQDQVCKELDITKSQLTTILRRIEKKMKANPEIKLYAEDFISSI